MKPRLQHAPRPAVLNVMCDECLRLGVPWLPELHGSKPRARPRARQLLAAKSVTLTKPKRKNRER